MNAAVPALTAPLAAALAGWMLSGSPVPMALSILVLVAVLLARPLLHWPRPAGDFGRRLLAAVLAGGALLVELRLFQRGEALAMRADLPLAYHWGLAALWWAAGSGLLRTRAAAGALPGESSLAGILGGLLVLGASAGTFLYDFGPWEVHPLAALPLACWTMRTLRPARPASSTLVFGAVPLSLAATGLVLAASGAADRLRELVHPRDESSLADLDAPAPSLDGNGPLGDASSRRLPREADIRFQNRVLVWVKAHSTELFRAWTGAPLYLRSSTLALFDSEEVLSPLRSGRWLYDLDDGVEDHTIHLRGGDPTEERPPASLHTYYLSRESASHLPLVGGARSLFAAAVYEFADGWYQLAPAEGIDRLRYTASAPPEPIGELRASDLRQPRRGEVSGIYLQMPPSPLSSRVAELCRGFDPADPIGEIRSLLAERTTYALRFTTPDHLSPLAEFLFGGGQGHCEHYAAATVLMLRALGIPSRVAYGYAGGLADRGQGLLAFRDSDFHAWAEVLTPQGEWKVFDTTPRVAAAPRRVPGPSSLPLVEAAHYHDYSEFDPSALAERSPWADWVADFVDFVSRHFLLATAGGLLLLGGLWRWFGKGDSFAGRARGGESGGLRDRRPLPPFLAEVEGYAAERGHARRPGQTWRELLDRLAVRAPSSGDALASEAVAYRYATLYGGAPPDAEEEERLLTDLRAARAALASD
jgi:transglutaminase-like putative cysteine protease